MPGQVSASTGSCPAVEHLSSWRVPPPLSHTMATATASSASRRARTWCASPSAPPAAAPRPRRLPRATALSASARCASCSNAVAWPRFRRRSVDGSTGSLKSEGHARAPEWPHAPAGEPKELTDEVKLDVGIAARHRDVGVSGVIDVPRETEAASNHETTTGNGRSGEEDGRCRNEARASSRCCVGPTRRAVPVRRLARGKPRSPSKT